MSGLGREGHGADFVPVVGDVAHDQGVVEDRAAGREGGGVVEEGGLDFVDGEVPHFPVVGREADAIEPAAVAGDGETDAAGLEEGGRLLKRAEAGAGGEIRVFAGGEVDAHRSVAGMDREVDAAVVVADLEVREVVFAGKDPAAGEVVRQRAGVAAGDEDAFALVAVGIGPQDGDPVGGVLAGDAGPGRSAAGADAFEADQADAGDGVAVVELRAEAGGQDAIQRGGIDPVVHQQAAADQAGDDGELEHLTGNKAESRGVSRGFLWSGGMDCGSRLPLWFASLLAKVEEAKRKIRGAWEAPVLETADGGLGSPAGWRSESGSGLPQSKARPRDQAGMRSLTASRSSRSSPIVASILPWLKASTGTPSMTSQVPLVRVRMGIEAMMPFSMP